LVDHLKKKYEFWEIALQQTQMFHNLVGFHLNHLNFWIWKHQLIKKNIVEVIFFQNFKIRRVIQDGATNHCFTLLSLTVIFQPILMQSRSWKIEKSWTCWKFWKKKSLIFSLWAHQMKIIEDHIIQFDVSNPKIQMI
jgi:hypothetical protein